MGLERRESILAHRRWPFGDSVVEWPEQWQNRLLFALVCKATWRASVFSFKVPFLSIEMLAPISGAFWSFLLLLLFLLFLFFAFLLFIWKTERKRNRDREGGRERRIRDLASTGSFPKCLQQALGSPSRSPMWAAGTQVSFPASRGAHKQEAGTGRRAEVKSSHLVLECRQCKQHFDHC